MLGKLALRARGYTKDLMRCKFAWSADLLICSQSDERGSRPTRAKEATDARDDRASRARALQRARLPQHDLGRHRPCGRRLDPDDLRLLPEQARHPLLRLPGN